MYIKSQNYILQLQFNDSARFMASALSDLADKHTEETHKIKCKYGYDNKKCETCGVKSKDCKCCLEYTIVQDNFVEQKCLCCKRNYQKTFNENLKSGLLHLANFITMIPIYLFYCCKKVFTRLNTWMIGKNIMKYYYLRKRIFKVA